MNSFRVLCLLFIFSAATAVHAADGGNRFDFRQKAEKKATSRWTLQEWLEQKDRNRMMDLWLGMYSPSPYEFYVRGAYQTYRTTYDPMSIEEKSYQSFSGGLGAYATIIGIEGGYENNT